jgi:inosine-uridine nucleoside N-ribohydrolase
MSQSRTVAVAFGLVLALVAGAAAQTPRSKVIFDTDIGGDIDDAWALGYVLKSPAFEVLGVTVADGDTAARAKIVCKILHRLGRADIPVAVGRKTAAMPVDQINYQFAWAEDFEAVRPVATPAVDFIAETIRRNPGQVTLIAVGPLQNIGDLVRKYPEVIRLVTRVVLMSGSVGPNAWSSTPVAEWNVKLAIDEARIVYAASWPLTTVPLDATTYVKLEDAEREALRRTRTPLVVALEALYRLWADWPTSRMTLHDQLAVVEAQAPGQYFGRCEEMPIRVDDAGFTRVDGSAGRGVTVCLEPKRDAFMKHFLGQIGAP